MRIIATAEGYPGRNSRGQESLKGAVFKKASQDDVIALVKSRITFGQRLTLFGIPAINRIVNYLGKPYLGKTVERVYTALESASNQLGEFASTIRDIRPNIKQSGIRSKMAAVQYNSDPDISSDSIHYDPAIHSAALVINELFLKCALNGIDPKTIQKVYFGCPTPAALNPSPEDRLREKLKRDGIIPPKIVDSWEFEYTSPKACVSAAKTLENISSDMRTKNINCALYAISAINTIHQDEDDLAQLFAYADESSAGIVFNDSNDKGIVLGELSRVMGKDVDKVTHPFQKRKYSFWENVKRYFVPPERNLNPKKIAVSIANESPKVLNEILNANDVSLFDLKHIVFSQTSKTVLDREETALIDSYRANKLQLPSALNPELKEYINQEFGYINFDSNVKTGEISYYFFKIIKESKTQRNKSEQISDLRSRLNPKESELLDLAEHLDRAVVRVYAERAYTGASSVLGALALLVDRGIIDLKEDPIALVFSGQGVNVQAALLNADKVPSLGHEKIYFNRFSLNGHTGEKKFQTIV